MPSTLIDAIAAGYAPPIHPMTIRDVELLMEQGSLREGDPFELLDGMLVLKDRRDPGAPETQPMGHGPLHASTVTRIQRALDPWQPSPHWYLRIQLPVQVSESKAPEPDTALVEGTPDDYDDRHPSPADVLVIFEASGTSLQFDRSTKQRIYASAGIPRYVVVNLPERTVELYESPDADLGQYTRKTILRPGESLRLELPGTGPIEIAVSSLLPGVKPAE